MTFSATEQFLNKKVTTWEVGNNLPSNLNESCVRLSVEPYEDDSLAFPDYFKKFLALDGVNEIDTLVIGCWGEAYEEDSSVVVNLLAEHTKQLPKLRHLFIGDLQLEEAEVSWIQQSDISAVYAAFPSLKTLKVRGGEGLSLGTVSHSTLESLIIETGGLDKSVIEQISSAELPQLKHVELWLGDDNYGCNIEEADLKLFLDAIGQRLPSLSYLGLCNYYLSDTLAKLVSENGFPETVTTLDLSMGNLSDEGGQHLLDSDKLSKLQHLDLTHHYLSDEMISSIMKSSTMPSVNLADQNEADEDDDEVYRYIFASE